MKSWIVQSFKAEDEKTLRDATAEMRRFMLLTCRDLEPEVRTQNIVFYEGHSSYGGGPNFGPEIQDIIDRTIAHAKHMRALTDPEYAEYLRLKEKYEKHV